MKPTASSPRGCSNETNVPTQQSTTDAHARLPRAHGNSGRTPGNQAPPRQGAQAPHRFDSGQASPQLGSAGRDQRFSKASRIRRRGDFLRIQRVGRRRAGLRFVVITVPARDGTARLGITASRKVGGAVVRNRIKRWVREFFRRSKYDVSPAQEILVIARPQAAEGSYRDVVQELGQALQLGTP